MAGLQVDDLAFDSEIMCDMCSVSVNYGEDYVAHLNIVHNINKHYNFFLDKAKEAMKGGQKREVDIVKKNFRGLSPKRVHQLPQRTIINSNSRLRQHLNHRSLNAHKQRKARRRKTILSLPLYLLTRKDVGKIPIFSQAQVRPGKARPSPWRTNTTETSARGVKKFKKIKAETGA